MENINMIEKIKKHWNAWSATKKTAIVVAAVVVILLII